MTEVVKNQLNRQTSSASTKSFKVMAFTNTMMVAAEERLFTNREE